MQKLLVPVLSVRNEELCLSGFAFQFFLYAPSGALPGAVIVQTKENLRQLRCIPQALEQHLIRHGAGRRIAVLLPSVLMEGQVGQQVDGVLKDIDLVALSQPVKTVLRRTSGGIAFEVPAGAAHMGMAGLSARVITHEHDIVVLLRFIDHLPAHKGCQHLPVNAAAVCR